VALLLGWLRTGTSSTREGGWTVTCGRSN